MKSSCAFVLACMMVACGNPSSTPENDPEEKKQAVFPVSAFITSQVRTVDSLQLPVFKFVTIDNKTDSTLISAAEFRALAREFQEPDINDPSISRFYKESSFADQSIPSVTLTYSTENNDLEIRRLDVNIDPSPVSEDKVKSIYLEKKSTRSDTSVYKKLYWRADRNCQIISSSQVADQPPAIMVLKCVWNHTD